MTAPIYRINEEGLLEVIQPATEVYDIVVLRDRKIELENELATVDGLIAKHDELSQI